MIGFSLPLSAAARTGWFKFRIAESLVPGEHDVHGFSGPPVRLMVYGPDYDEQDNPTAVIEAIHPYIDGIGWDDIWEAVQRQYPTSSPIRRATEAEYQALKESIAAFGPLQRVIVDEMGNVIAGRLRKKACAELGKNCPTEVISGLTPDLKNQLSFELDFCRKHFSRGDKRRAAEFILRVNPRNTDRVIGRATGLDHKTVGSIRVSLEERGEIPHVEQRQGADGKQYKFSKIAVDTKREEERATTGLQLLGTDAPKKRLPLSRVEELVRLKQAAERKATQPPTLLDASIQIVHSDFRNLQIADDSVPLVMTDPPYDKAAVELWKDLAVFAKRVLRPDGFLVTYSGIMFLPEVMAALSSELKYVWQIALIHDGGQDNVWPRNVVNKYKPLLVFAKGETRSPALISDVLYGSGKEKQFHEWQQNIEEVSHFIEKFTEPGQLVVDPFGGGFTTAAACYRLGRRCISCDVDPGADEHLTRLRHRGLGAKRSLALREFALGIEALERFVRHEPLRRVHECVFGVLALESEPVDPRL